MIKELEIQKRVKELEKQIGKKVFYNGESYIMKEVVNNFKYDTIGFQHEQVVILTPIKPIAITGEDILIIEDSKMEMVNYPDGTSEFKSVPISLKED